MLNKFEWDYGSDKILFSISTNENINVLKYQIDIALKEILSNHFQNIPYSKIKYISSIAIEDSFKGLNNLYIREIEEEIYIFLDINLLKSIKKSFEIIENILKNIRLSSRLCLNSSPSGEYPGE